MKNGIPVLLALLVLAGCDQLSSIVSPKAEDTTPPGEVVNLVAVPGNGQVSLTWVDPADADLAAVQVTAAGQTTPVAKGTQSVQLTGLANGTDVLILVRTVDKSGNRSSGVSVTSRPVSAIPSDTTPPGEVQNLTAIPGDGIVALAWTEPTDGDFHHVVVKGAGQTLTAAKGTPSALVTGLTNGTSYAFTVASVDAAGNPSAGVSVTAVPVAPVSTTFTVTFDTQGGSAVNPAAGLSAGALVPAPAAPTKSGAAFAGWFADSAYTVPWDFAVDPVTANQTLHARWGSASAVGVWFGLQNGLPDEVDPSVDDTESILQFRTDGTFSFYQRRHAVLASSYWSNLEENAFYELKAGSYYWNSANNSLTLNPRKVDVIRLVLLTATRTESELTAADASWPSKAGLKTYSQAQALWGDTGDWAAIASLYEKQINTAAHLGTNLFTDFDGSQTTLEYQAPGQTPSDHEVWQATYLDAVGHETRGGFRAPKAVGDFPAAVQGLLPALPTTIKVSVVNSVFAAYTASPFFQGLGAAGSAIWVAAQSAGQSNATSLDQSGTAGPVHWTNVESWSVSGTTISASGNQTYKPTGDEALSGGLTLLATSLGAISYAATSQVTSPNSATFSKNLGVWTLRFSGSVVSSLEYTWDDVAKAVVGNVLINGTQSLSPTVLQ